MIYKYAIIAVIVAAVAWKIDDNGFKRAEKQCNADAAVIATALRESQNALQSAIDEIDQNDTKIDQLQTELDTANATASGLLDAAKKHSARVCPKAASATSNGKATKATDDMLPDLLGRCGARAVELARYADEVVIAHSKCLAAYDAAAKK